MNLPLMNRLWHQKHGSEKGQSALIYRFADEGLTGVSAGFSAILPGCRHFDCDQCSATDLCPYRELTILLRGEDLLGIELQWREAQFWLRFLPLQGRRLNFLIVQSDDLLEPDVGELLSGFGHSATGCSADVSVRWFSSLSVAIE